MSSTTGDTAATPSTVARQLLERVRREQPTETHEQTLAAFDEDALAEVRTDRRTALAFWLNVYNAGAQLLLDRRPELFESRWRFFRATAITVAGIDVSLDDIEHGLMRNRQSKYGLGYLPRLARCGFGPAYRLPVDPRIHFALNCGAASCPAILSYDAETVDRALDDATEQYLAQHVQYDAATDRVRVPRVCLWFIGDFGGPSGLRAFLRDYGQVPRGASPSLSFDGYDWTRVPRQFDTRE
ncbi:DUF547 domain-containing protein [Halosegnis longus]|uniref:DUF547 domain-containing protein n=1 Tax=Halosegnis longus TaxID=2216012 RepID=UPI00096A6114|nr:DUF547 domain-containing protein [Salella cibi]